MKFCSSCSALLHREIPQGDTLQRFVCSSCGTIHYQNPKIVVGCIPVWQDSVLLCKRAIDPQHGKWTLPAGFMENGESSDQGALRETLEEANARVELQGLFAVLNVPHIDQVHMIYRARLLDADFSAGHETLDVRLYTENEIPWDELAFRTNRLALRHFFSDRSTGTFRLHEESIVRQS